MADRGRKDEGAPAYRWSRSLVDEQARVVTEIARASLEGRPITQLQWHSNDLVNRKALAREPGLPGPATYFAPEATSTFSKLAAPRAKRPHATMGPAPASSTVLILPGKSRRVRVVPFEPLPNLSPPKLRPTSKTEEDINAAFERSSRFHSLPKWTLRGRESSAPPGVAPTVSRKAAEERGPPATFAAAPPSSLGRQVVSSRASAPSVNFGAGTSRDALDKIAMRAVLETPGAGHYHPRGTGGRDRTAPSFSIKGREGSSAELMQSMMNSLFTPDSDEEEEERRVRGRGAAAGGGRLRGRLERESERLRVAASATIPEDDAEAEEDEMIEGGGVRVGPRSSSSSSSSSSPSTARGVSWLDRSDRADGRRALGGSSSMDALGVGVGAGVGGGSSSAVRLPSLSGSRSTTALPSTPTASAPASATKGKKPSTIDALNFAGLDALIARTLGAFRSKGGLASVMHAPGPGSYSIPSMMGRQAESRRPSARAAAMGPPTLGFEVHAEPPKSAEGRKRNAEVMFAAHYRAAHDRRQPMEVRVPPSRAPEAFAPTSP